MMLMNNMIHQNQPFISEDIEKGQFEYKQALREGFKK